MSSNEVPWFDEYFRETYDTWRRRAGRAWGVWGSDGDELVAQLFTELYDNRARIATDRESLARFMRDRMKKRVIDRWRRLARESGRDLLVGDEFLGEIRRRDACSDLGPGAG